MTLFLYRCFISRKQAIPFTGLELCRLVISQSPWTRHCAVACYKNFLNYTPAHTPTECKPDASLIHPSGCYLHVFSFIDRLPAREQVIQHNLTHQLNHCGLSTRGVAWVYCRNLLLSSSASFGRRHYPLLSLPVILCSHPVN